MKVKPATLPRLEDGWLLVECAADSLTPVWIKVGRGEFTPAYRDYDEGRRVAKIRHPGVTGKSTVKLKVGEVVAAAGSIGA